MEEFWLWTGNLSALLGILGSIGALLAWRQTKKISADVERERLRLNQEVFLVLQSTESQSAEIRIPFALRRGEITRSEILGLIGMLPMRSGLERNRFAIRFLTTEEFRKKMSQIQDGSEGLEWIIPCSDEEIFQFNLDALKKYD